MDKSELKVLLQASESETLEFKPRLSARNRGSQEERDIKAKKDIEHRILKSIAGLLNCAGGTLVVGVDNHRVPNGKLLEGFKNVDEVEVHLTNLVVENLGPLAAANIQVTFVDNVDGYPVLVIECPFNADVFPVYVSQGQSASARILYVRVNNTTREYSGEDQIKYIDFIRKRHTQTSGTGAAQIDSTVAVPAVLSTSKEPSEQQHTERKAPLRTVYLQASLSINGRNALKGRALYDRLSEMSDDTLLGHLVLEDTDAASYREIGPDIISHSQLREFAPSVIYLEGGLFANNGGWWRVPRSIATEFCQSGGVVIVADVGQSDLFSSAAQAHYSAAATFFRAQAAYILGIPNYGEDKRRFWGGSNRSIVCDPNKMILDDWIRPIYSDVPEILVSDPVKLNSWESLVASCNSDSTTTWTERYGKPKEEVDACPFGACRQIGSGFAALITGYVSADALLSRDALKRGHQNTTWLGNLANFLVTEAQAEIRRRKSVGTAAR